MLSFRECCGFEFELTLEKSDQNHLGIAERLVLFFNSEKSILLPKDNSKHTVFWNQLEVRKQREKNSQFQLNKSKIQHSLPSPFSTRPEIPI